MCKKSICLILLFLVLGLIQTLVVATPGDLLQTFTSPTGDDNDRFSVSIAGLGENILVGAGYDDTAGPYEGAAYLFDPNGTLLQTFLSPEPADTWYFAGSWGPTVAAVGNNVLIGTEHISGWAAYLFDPNGALLQSFYNPTPLGEYWGNGGVAGMGNNVLVSVPFGDWKNGTGADVVYLFDSSTGDLLRTFNNPMPISRGDYFGWTMAAVGDNIVIGAPDNDADGPMTGVVHLFNGSTGALLHTFHSPNPIASGKFGWSVTTFGDDILIGTGNELKAYLFDGSTYELLRTFVRPVSYGGFGASIVGIGNNILIASSSAWSPDPGAAYLFNGATGNLLHTFHHPNPRSYPINGFYGGFGWNIAAVGNNILVGAYEYYPSPPPYVAAAYLFDGRFWRGDFEPDGDVDFFDFAVLALAWQSEDGDDNWNQACDISEPSDDVIDYNDLAVFTENWLAGTE